MVETFNHSDGSRLGGGIGRSPRWAGHLVLVVVIVLGVGTRPAPAMACVGDCNENGIVAIGELIVGVSIALGSQPPGACQAFLCQGGDTVPINCLIQGVNGALNDCAGEPTPTLSGSCAKPGSSGLTPCDEGTVITVFRCDDRTQCLHQQGLSMVGATTVGNDGAWSVQIASADTGATLIAQARISAAVVYRALALGSAGSALGAALAGSSSPDPIAITPLSEAVVRLLDSQGFQNYSDAAVGEVVSTVEQATAELSFAGVSADAAVMRAVDVANADPTVMMALQRAGGTPTASPPPSTPSATATDPGATPTSTPTRTATAIPTTPSSRYVDNDDGTITDHQTGLTWEKKDRAGGVHDVDAVYYWAGLCSDGSDYCQPNAAAAACSTVPGVTSGCSLCARTATCDTLTHTTIWDWVAQLNAAGFAGHSDWRIPTVKHDDGGTVELETIRERVGNSCGLSVPCVPDAFNTDCADGCTLANCSCAEPRSHWTASFPTDQIYAVYYDFADGLAEYDFKWNTFERSLYAVRAVRGGGDRASASDLRP